MSRRLLLIVAALESTVESFVTQSETLFWPSFVPQTSHPKQTTLQESNILLAANGDSETDTLIQLSLDPDGRQAGTDGYSVMRQPLSQTNWGESAPENDVPMMLQDDTKNNLFAESSISNEQWLRRFKDNNQSRKDKESSSRRRSKDSERIDDEVEELDLFQRTFDTLDYPRVIRALSEDYATTLPAQNILRNRQPARKKSSDSEVIAYQPFLADSVQGTRERYRAVQELEWILQGKLTGDEAAEISNDYYYRNRYGYKQDLVGCGPPTGGNAFALEPILQAAATGGLVLESPQLEEISSALGRMQEIQSWAKALTRIEEVEFVQLPKLADAIDYNETLQELLDSALDDEGRLSGATFPAVGRLRARVKALRGDVLSTLESLVQMPSIQSKLALESGGPLFSEINGGRLVIPLEASNAKQQRQASTVGIVHDTSRSGKTVYVEPTEIVGPTNELRQAEGELQTEEARIWRYLTQQVLVNQRALETSIYAVGQLDLVQARLQLGQSWQGIVPTVKEEGVICLRDAMHPVLLLRKKDNVVPSDIDLGANGNQGLVLTGPNSGGKTVILKLLGLVALMSRGGIPIPAATGDYQPRVDFFDPVLADIGDIQSVGSDLSTFSGHMLVCKQVLENSGRNALILMDELGSGTDPAQGVAIAQALLEAILETGARAAITTHYMQLKQLAASDERFAVAGMQFINGQPTYKLLPGTVGESFALAVAERLELPASVLNRANELLDADTRKLGDLISELEDQKAVIDAQVEEMEEKKREMAKMEFQLKERQMKLEKKQLNVRREEARRFAKKLEEKEQVLEDVLTKLKSDPSRKLIARSWDDIRFVKRDALNEAENVPSVLKRKAEADAAMEEASAELIPISEMGPDKPVLAAGDKVMVCRRGPLFSREGIIVRSTRNRVELKVGNLNVALKFSEVALPPKGGRPPQTNKKNAPSAGRSLSKKAQRALDQEKGGSRRQTAWEELQTENKQSHDRSDATIRTQANTVDVRGCNLMEAKEKVKEKASSLLIQGRKNSVVFVLHGHGTGGVLKSKIRQWLKSDRTVAKRWSPADSSDGGDAFTRVQLN